MTGFIGVGQLKYILTNLGEKMTEEEVDELLKAVDTSSGQVNYTGTQQAFQWSELSHLLTFHAQQSSSGRFSPTENNEVMGYREKDVLTPCSRRSATKRESRRELHGLRDGRLALESCAIWIVLNLGAWIGLAVAPFRIWDRVHS